MKKILIIIITLTFPFISWSQQTINYTITVEGVQREFILYIPASYNGNTKVPLVFNFHGLGGTAQRQMEEQDFRPVADTAGFIVVHPLGAPIIGPGLRGWNMGNDTLPNDVLFTSKMIDTIAADFNINLDRVYACGMSFGGYFSVYLAEQLSDRIATIASVAGTILNNVPDSIITPKRPIALLEIHGTSDNNVPYNGNQVSKSVQYLLDLFVNHNNCDTSPAITSLPDINTNDGSTVERFIYPNGDNGTTVEHIKINGGRHTWPGENTNAQGVNRDINGCVEIWKFFSRFDINGAIEEKSQDSSYIISAFFGLDNALPLQANLLCPGALGMDGMPVNFKLPIDASSLSASDFEVVDSLGNIHIPNCAILAPANENGENRTVLLIGELGNDSGSKPVEVRIVGELLTINNLPEECTFSEVINLKGLSTKNVVPLKSGPSLFFAQKIEGSLNECSEGAQTIQVAWDGGIIPYNEGDLETDLIKYYTGYSDSSGVLIPHVPVSISDINDNDNYHQLCFSTSDKIIKISMMANTVEDPNQDPNQYTEIDVINCENTPSSIEEATIEDRRRIYPNPFSDEIFIDNLVGDEYFIIHDFLGRKFIDGRGFGTISLPEAKPGIYYLTVLNNSNPTTYKLIKR